MPHSTPGSTAFVLAGGGTKGSFEVGALQYLVGIEHIIPDVITATSAGALAAVVLAQARTHEEFLYRVQEIEDDIVAMTRTEHVFGQQAWLQALKGTSLGDSILFALTEGTRPELPVHADAKGASTDLPQQLTRHARAARRADRRERRRRRRHVLTMAIGAALRLPGVRRKLRTSGSAALNLQPLADALRQGGPSGIRPIDTDLIKRPGLQLRLAVTALRAGVLRYVSEDGTIVEADARTPAPEAAAGPVDVVEGALASASVPMVFPPRHLADDDYVDGGVLQVIPTKAAAQLGATRIIAVAAIPLRVARDERDFAAGPAANIVIRAMGMIGLAERQRENLEVALPEHAGLITIDPHVDVVGYFEVQPGLLRINKDYGWLRAADVMAQGDATLLAEVSEQTHRLVEVRLRAWHQEEALWADGATRTKPDAGSLALLQQHKEQIYRLVDQRKQLGFPVPDGCEAWWTEYELHHSAPPDTLPPSPTFTP
ncbi:MAG TPA: patatin-like phospholipase family protein [Acidimicrobiales bacterium]|nr:patatin-like phospholipase family protein [Acidimicrobiales bacterium]